MKTRKTRHSGTMASGRGFALLGSIALIIVFAGLSLTYFMISSTSMKHASRRESGIRLESTATSVAQMIAQEIWNRYSVNNGGKPGDLDSFRDFLDSGVALAQLSPGANGAFGPEVDAKLLVNVDAADETFGQLRVVSATVRRRDSTLFSDVDVTVAMATGASLASDKATVKQSFTIGGAQFKGFEYALLSNNVNCIMCHATVDNAQRYYNSDSSALGTFDRAKVGTLSSLQIRAHDAYSEVYGTIHSRGKLMDSEGNPLGSLVGTTLTGAEMSGIGKLLEGQNASIYQDDLSLAVGEPLPQYGQLYLDYPMEVEDMTDGELPTSFPPPVPDIDGDKRVDPEEFALVAENANGTLSGTIVAVPKGQTFEAFAGTGGLTPSIAGTAAKNIVMMGTDANPIQIDGKVAIDGDVVLFGVVKGEGAIYASGNVYIVGDLTYKDGVDANGNQTFGIGSDGKPNALAIAAGGNIVAGDHLSIPNWGVYKDNPAPVNGDGTGSYNFTMNEIAIFNCNEWSKTQQTLPGKDGLQVPNPGYIESYTPSYYVLNEGNPVFIMNGANLTPETQSQLYFDPATGLWKGKELLNTYEQPFLQTINKTDAGYTSAVIKPLSPHDGWLSTPSLQNLRKLAETLHATGAMHIDALLYTNNAAFTMVRNKSKYQGKLLLNGGLVAADTGVLLPNGLSLNFDPRPSEFVDLWDLTKPVEMRRTVWRRASSYATTQP